MTKMDCSISYQLPVVDDMGVYEPQLDSLLDTDASVSIQSDGILTISYSCECVGSVHPVAYQTLKRAQTQMYKLEGAQYLGYHKGQEY